LYVYYKTHPGLLNPVINTDAILPWFVVPRTQANQEVLGCAGKEKTGPQFLVTLLYHMGSALPWRWKIGAGTNSERGHLQSMLKRLPLGSLLVADAGFTGYDLLENILSHPLSFLIRVGANVTLLRGLGFEFERHGNIVWLWPQNKRDQEPLKLRLIRLKAKAKYARIRRDVYLLTNVFDPEYRIRSPTNFTECVGEWNSFIAASNRHSISTNCVAARRNKPRKNCIGP